MSGASFQEFFLLLIIGLVVLGPKRLPQVANQLGSWLGQARRMTRMMKRQLEDEINVDLDDFNVKKQLGLDGSNPARKEPSVSSPSYVHDPAPASKPPAAGDEKKAADEAPMDPSPQEPAELPDDYSPAHAADQPGTGVDDDEPDDDDGRDIAANHDVTEDSTAAEPSVDKKAAG